MEDMTARLRTARARYNDTIKLRDGQWPDGKVPTWVWDRIEDLTGCRTCLGIHPTSGVVTSWAADQYIAVLEEAVYETIEKATHDDPYADALEAAMNHEDNDG